MTPLRQQHKVGTINFLVMIQYIHVFYVWHQFPIQIKSRKKLWDWERMSLDMDVRS